MRRTITFGLVLLCACLAAGCDWIERRAARAGFVQSLGEYEVKGVEFVPEMPPFGHDWEKARYLKVELDSSHRLSIGYPTYWIGSASDYCPLKSDFGLVSLGPIDDRGVQIGRVAGEGSPRKSADGRFHYQVFVVPAHPMPGLTYNSGWKRAPYDLISDARDICLQIIGGDHDDVFARSSVIRVSFEQIRKAQQASELGSRH